MQDGVSLLWFTWVQHRSPAPQVLLSPAMVKIGLCVLPMLLMSVCSAVVSDYACANLFVYNMMWLHILQNHVLSCVIMCLCMAAIQDLHLSEEAAAEIYRNTDIGTH